MMIGKTTTLAVLVTALLAGLGTTIWTLATTSPVEIPQLDPIAVATHNLIEAPDRIDNWTRVGHWILGHGDPAEQIPLWLDSLDPDWAESHGAEAMIWYSASHILAREPSPAPPDYGKPEAVAARKRAVDLLISFSQNHPDSMRYWHWNTLGWVWARSGQKGFARGALQRADDLITEEADSLTPDELVSGIIRLASCWSNRGVGDQAEQQAVLVRFRDIISRRGEDLRSGMTYPNLARWQWRANDRDGATETVDLVQAKLLKADPAVDHRLPWRQIADVYIEIEQPERAIFALGRLTEELNRHHEAGPQITWNQIGWDYDSLGEHERAQEVWRRWLDTEQELADHDPSSANLYNLACGLALVGDGDAAMEALEKAVRAGWSDPGQIRSDRDLTSLRGDSRFERLIADLVDHLRSEMP